MDNAVLCAVYCIKKDDGTWQLQTYSRDGAWGFSAPYKTYWKCKRAAAKAWRHLNPGKRGNPFAMLETVRFRLEHCLWRCRNAYAQPEQVPDD